MASNYSGLPSSGKNNVVIVNGVEVCAEVGSIINSKLQVDAIVCSMSRRRGSLAEQIIGTNRKLRNYVSARVSNDLKQVTDVLLCPRDICQKPYHVLLTRSPSSLHPQGVQSGPDLLESTFKNCLERARKCRNVRSIAIPAIGSGHGGYDVGIVIGALVNAILAVLSQPSTANSELKRILFISHNSGPKLFPDPDIELFLGLVRAYAKGSQLPSAVADSSRAQQANKQNGGYKPGKQKPLPESKFYDKGDDCNDANQSSHGPSVFYTGTGASADAREFDDRKEVDDDGFDAADFGVAQGTCSRTPKSVQQTSIQDDKCPICFDAITRSNKGEIPGCKHVLCKDCFGECSRRNPICPVCRKAFGVVRGNQPEGTMMANVLCQPLEGYLGYGMIAIDYTIMSGIQTEDHPNPGKPYVGINRRAYLPDNEKGRKVLKLLRRAFDARLTFTIGTSVTNGMDNVITWNDIHHKTSTSGGPQRYGYPDMTYLDRVIADLAAKGIE